MPQDTTNGAASTKPSVNAIAGIAPYGSVNTALDDLSIQATAYALLNVWGMNAPTAPQNRWNVEAT